VSAIAVTYAADFRTIDTAVVIDMSYLLFIGIGPKNALARFLEVTSGMDDKTKRRVANQMLRMAGRGGATRHLRPTTDQAAAILSRCALHRGRDQLVHHHGVDDPRTR
jgi:hypothetical protein